MIDDGLNSALLALKNGERNSARSILADILRSNPKHELAWYWLATCVDSIQQQKDCLSRVVALNPNNLQAKAALAKLEHTVPMPDNKTGDALPANTQTISGPTNPSRPPSVHAQTLSPKAGKHGGIKGEIWIGIGILMMLVSCGLLAIIGGYTLTNPGANPGVDLPASDPTKFKIAAGKYQLIEAFTQW